MRASTPFACLAAAALWQAAPVAHACGGFFCSRAPVDQAAERIVFTVHEEHTDMVVQITYQGRDEDFAWVLPLADVPDAESLEVVPQAALNALDVNTEPTFTMHPDCQPWIGVDSLGGVSAGGPTMRGAEDEGGVTVHVRQEVGPYDLAVISSDDPDATSQWLRDNEYNIAPSMDPYIKLYTQEKMKFLALRLTAGSTADDIEPLKLELPGTTPGIPLRLTTLAAEPEMGIKVWIFADQRFEPANAEETEINPDELRWQPWSWGYDNNYAALVARQVDKFDGQAWVAEMAGDVEELRQMIETSPVNSPEQEEAQEALLAMLGDSSYLTRLYTRVSPEEMTYDPLFRRSMAEDVDRNIQLPYVEKLCGDAEPPPPEPCDFAACGDLGLCRPTMDEETQTEVAGCACAPGATARTTFAPDGVTPMVSCQDERLSFLNPGDRLSEDAERLPDPCVGFDCGEHGQCVAMNLTPTCQCEKGYVAVGSLAEDGTRSGRCAAPLKEIPETFYNRRPRERDEQMPVGRDVNIEPPEGPSDVEMMETDAGAGGGSTGGPATDGETEDADVTASGGGCAALPGSASGSWMLGLLTLALASRRRRPTVL